jgi:hypothetical protein
MFKVRRAESPTNCPSAFVICAKIVVAPGAITVNGNANWVRAFAGIVRADTSDT